MDTMNLVTFTQEQVDAFDTKWLEEFGDGEGPEMPSYGLNFVRYIEQQASLPSEKRRMFGEPLLFIESRTEARVAIDARLKAVAT